MKKVFLSFSIILMIGLIPQGFSHADPESMTMITNGTIQQVKVIGLGPTEETDKEEVIPIFGLHPVIFTLYAGIVAIMGIFTCINYREDITVLKNIKREKS